MIPEGAVGGRGGQALSSSVCLELFLPGLPFVCTAHLGVVSVSDVFLRLCLRVPLSES